MDADIQHNYLSGSKCLDESKYISIGVLVANPGVVQTVTTLKDNLFKLPHIYLNHDSHGNAMLISATN